jgi:hypothetical protein
MMEAMREMFSEAHAGSTNWINFIRKSLELNELRNWFDPSWCQSHSQILFPCIDRTSMRNNFFSHRRFFCNSIESN